MKFLVAGISAIIIIIGCLIIGADYQLKEAYDVSLIGTTAHVLELSKGADEDELCTNPFDIKTDMVSVESFVNEAVQAEMIKRQENGYYVDFGSLANDMKFDIRLTDRQVGALCETVIKQEMGGQVEVNGLYMDIELLEVLFEETKNGTRVQLIIAVDSKRFKDAYVNLPEGVPKELDVLVDKIPDKVYFTSIFDVIKGEEPFTYDISHVGLRLNNLGIDQTSDFLNTVDKFLGIGTAEYINMQIADATMISLVGSAEQRGLAYSLRGIGAVDFDFVKKDNQVCFAVHIEK